MRPLQIKETMKINLEKTKLFVVRHRTTIAASALTAYVVRQATLFELHYKLSTIERAVEYGILKKTT